MAHATLACVVPDGTVPTDGTLARTAVPTPVYWPIGDGGTIDISAIGEDGEVYDLAGCTMTLVCRRNPTDAAPVLQYEAAIDPTPEGGEAPGTATVTVLAADTEDMVAGVTYWFDVRLVDDSDVVYHILPASRWLPVVTVARADEPPEPEPAP